MATSVRIKYIQAPLDSLEQRVNAAITHLEAVDGEIIAVQVVPPTDAASSAGAVIVVRKSVAAGTDTGPSDDLQATNSGTRTHEDEANRGDRDYELGRRLQEERALRHRVRRMQTARRAESIASA